MTAATSSVPPREVFADVTRRITAEHTDWDSPHQFFTLHWDGEKVSFGTLAVITPGIHPTAYPALMAKIAKDELDEERGDTVYAYALQIEGWGVVAPGPEATETERQRFHADRVGRTFHQRDDATEFATTWCADVHGRTWSAAKRRTRPDDIEVNFWAPGQASGQLVTGLLSIAQATGMVLYGLPAPPAGFGGR